ncbi:hypothetical protein [Bradyrhizobium sp. Arg816]|uniref:hypothetical protein n=1 Tax=Bradyrhizobium sp. Arg816 TaxID=2998491 RepID=UPI00249DEE65|nr:hypothetical protein [Bradyrhizobium sp. Arg816]MDI3559849.1 hypothetical protein [Bradyrhizobium sp. Arg816]
MTDETDQPRFGAAEVIQIASKLTVDDATFVIGGQATNLWAWYYRDKDPALRQDQPLTSRDLDYFGSVKAAESLAAALGGKVIKATLDDMNTPHSAVVLATVNGKPLKIDFLNGVLGVTRRELERGVAVIEATAEVDGKECRAQIPVLHPVLCLKSRIANMLHPMLGRRDSFAWAQLHAAIAIVRVYIVDALEEGDWKEAKSCLSDVFEYLRSDRFGKAAKNELGVDVLDILRHFQDDQRIDERYRKQSLVQMIEQIEDWQRKHSL